MAKTSDYLKDIKKLSKKSFVNFLFKEGKTGVESLNLNSLSIVALVISCFIGLFVVYKGLTEDTSSIAQTDQSIQIEQSLNEVRAQGAESDNPLVNALFKIESFYDDDLNTRPKTRGLRRGLKRKYKAKQVIQREDIYEPEKTIPIGTNLIGKLLTSIDTRETEQFYKVFLPYGGNFREGAEIPKGSSLFGKVKYSGKGKKVFLHFTKGVFPNGRQFEIQAQALDSKDYSVGIRGDFHGKSGARLAASLGLSIVSGAASVLTEREEIGSLGASLPKATLKNALYGGLSQASQQEAQRRAQSLSEQQEYVTVDAGKDLIINLTGEYKQK